MMKVIKTITALQEEIKAYKQANKTIGLVTTMGALHEGHASLIKAASEENDVAVVSVFVNPTQFGPTEDLDSYPRTLDADCRLAEGMGADVVFAPTPQEMYPSADMTWVEVTGNITKVLCGATRPIHFRGVATVVAKFFNLVQPDKAYFGQKDAQQVQVLQRMVRDLFFPLELRVMPIIREADGLAKSSRNTYLSAAERQSALILSQSLRAVQASFAQGERTTAKLLEQVTNQIKTEPMAVIDYVSLYQLPDLTECPAQLSGRSLLAVAVKFGNTRLIDNVILEDK